MSTDGPERSVGVGGVGEFILGNTNVAVGQLVLLLIGVIAGCVVGCILCGCAISGNDSGLAGGAVSSCIGCLAGLASFAGFIWIIIDGAFILQGKVTDVNGYNTY